MALLVLVVLLVGDILLPVPAVIINRCNKVLTVCTNITLLLSVLKVGTILTTVHNNDIQKSIFLEKHKPNFVCIKFK